MTFGPPRPIAVNASQRLKLSNLSYLLNMHSATMYSIPACYDQKPMTRYQVKPAPLLLQSQSMNQARSYRQLKLFWTLDYQRKALNTRSYGVAIAQRIQYGNLYGIWLMQELQFWSSRDVSLTSLDLQSYRSNVRGILYNPDCKNYGHKMGPTKAQDRRPEANLPQTAWDRKSWE